MSGKKQRINYEKFQNEVGAWISDKIENVEKAVIKAVDKTASKTAKELREDKYLPRYVPVNRALNNSRKTKLGVRKLGDRSAGTYKSFASQRAMSRYSKSKSDFRRVVYIRSPEYRLSHLLENGHRIVNKYGDTGKRTRPVEHFHPAEEQAVKDLREFAGEELKTGLGVRKR